MNNRRTKKVVNLPLPVYQPDSDSVSLSW